MYTVYIYKYIYINMFNIHKMDFLSLLKIGIPAWLKVIHSMNFECKTWSHRGRPTTGRIRMRPLQSCSGAGTGWNCVKASQLGRSTTEYWKDKMHWLQWFLWLIVRMEDLWQHSVHKSIRVQSNHQFEVATSASKLSKWFTRLCRLGRFWTM